MALKKSALYSSLWQSCDELRGSMDASQYKNYVLVLLFMKYVSDKYAGRTDALLEVPEGGSFQDMVAAIGQKDIGDRLNKIISKMAEANGLSGVLDVPEADFNDDNKLGSGQEMVDMLSGLVAIFNKPELNFTQNRGDGDDLLGDAYEYLMRHFATESGKSKGQFYTPSEVSRVIAKIVGIDQDTRANQSIYDPTCGSGSLLLKAADEALPTKISIFGQEMDNATYALARMNMILHGHDGADLVKGNTLASPANWGAAVNQLKQHDFIVANPPFSTKKWMNGLTPDADPYGRFTGFGVPPAKNGDYAFLLHIVRSLKGNGKAVVVLPHGVLFRGNAEGTIRRNLVQKGYLKGIIGLPANLFYGTGIPACLLVLDKEGAATRTHLFMVDASRGYLKDGNKNRLREQDQHRIVDVWRRQEDEKHFARLVPLTEIAGHGYNLNLPRYVEGPPTQDRHDIEAHLRGGLPAADLEALAAYWDVYPTLRDVLTEPGDRPGYFRLRVAPDDIRPTIFEHPEFRAFRQQVEETFGTWVEQAEPLLRGITPDTKPKDLLETLSEALLATFGPVHLLDGYDVYQRLMNYWTATLQDDMYHVVAEGWEAMPYRPLVGKVDKDKPNKKQRLGPWTSDLVPRELLISRYLTTEQQAVETAAEALAEATRLREELEEEYTGEDGTLSELDYNNPTQLAAAVKARLKELTKGAKPDSSLPKRGRKPKYDPANPPADLFAGVLDDEPATPAPAEVAPDPEELTALNALEAALSQESAAKKALTKAQAHLEAQILPAYERLTPEATRDLLVTYKWLDTLHRAVGQELSRLSQGLARRLDELDARYITPLPQQEAAVAALTQQVETHLQAMGFSWN
jgi:type I restriction enzyme M protein